MKRFAAVTLATLMLLTVFASAASAEVANTTLNSLEIRGPVYNGTGLTDIIATQGSNGAITMNANNFAAFFYDINNNVTTETLAIKNGAGTSGRVIGKDQLVYQTTIAKTDAKYKGFGNYSVLGFFADKYIPLKSNDASKLAKLVLDTDDKYTLKTGEKLDLGSGYSLQAKQVDVDGKKVWLEFDKDGQYVDDQIVATDTGDHVWTSELDKIQGEDNVPVLKVHVNQVFQGAVDSIAQIDGLWLIDYANAMKINSDDEFGKLNNVAINGATLTISNDDTFTLTRDSDQEIGQGLFFKIADSDALRYYPYVEKTIGNATAGNASTGPVIGKGANATTPANVTTPVNATTPATNETTTAPAEPGVTPAAGTTPVTATANNTSGGKGTPGFEIVPGIVGLLAVVYFVRKHK
jgi:S-layer protein (TIGR01567 family)